MALLARPTELNREFHGQFVALSPGDETHPEGPLVVQDPSTILRIVIEPGIVTLLKIVGTLVAAISVIPLLFLFSPGAERGEPRDDEEAAKEH